MESRQGDHHPRVGQPRGHPMAMRIPSAPKTVFSKPAEANISLLDLTTAPTTTSPLPLVFRHDEPFWSHISTAPEPKVRIISIWCGNSVRPLGITQSTMHALIDRYDIGIEFLDLVHSFGEKAHVSDVGHGGATVYKRANGAYDMHYSLPYVENYAPQGKPPKYTDRSLCVFNRYSPGSDGEHLWIFLYPERNGEAQQRVHAAASLGIDWCRNPQYLHLTVLAAYMGNWRWYIRTIGEEVENVTNRVTVSRFSEETDYSQVLDWLIRMSRQREILLPVAPKLRVVQKILRKLVDMDTTLAPNPPGRSANAAGVHRTSDYLAFYLQRVEGHLLGLQALEGKVQSTLDLLEVAVDLGNRDTTAQINKKMLKLTSHSVDDSAAVRIITFLTMLYLPPSFVSTFLGMQLFSFENADGTERFGISKHFWVFVALCLPLSTATFFSWRIFWARQRRKRVAQEREQQGQGVLGKDVEAVGVGPGQEGG
ncbi:hypothetical protein BJY00DRAFT_227338 [Aspergillus carlsbadensis]|nr:hypothetical protein BJY00DRAFT_227338 [Aspergillus carlsbadensis]